MAFEISSGQNSRLATLESRCYTRLTEVVETTQISRVVAGCRSGRAALTRGLVVVGQGVEGHPITGLAVVQSVWLLAALNYSLGKPMWHDELFTFFIAQAPTVGELLHQTRHIDLNPPLSYLLTRASLHLFGVGTLQCRLPEIIGFAGALGGIFLFLRRRVGNAYGLLAASLLLAGRSAEVGFQARPYGLMLGFTAMSLAAWQASSAEARDTRRGMVFNSLLFAAMAALLLTHVFGLLVWAALLAAELVQSVQRRGIDRGRLLALLLPLAATLLYAPLQRNYGSSAFPQAFQASPADVFNFYIGQVDRYLVCIWLSAAVIVFTAGRSWLRGGKNFCLTTPEWVAISGLIAVPFVVIFRLMLAHAAFFERYGVAGGLGICILFAVFFCWWAGSRPSAAVVAALIAILISSRLPDAIGAVVEGQIFRHVEPSAPPFPLSELKDPSLPLVDASGLTFTEMNHREPAQLLGRTYYLTDGPAALQYAHATIFEGMEREVQAFHLPARSEPYSQFVREHPRFYVFGTYDYPEDWLLRKLQADGAELRRIGKVDPSSYKDQELYEVSFALTSSQSK